MTLALVLGLPLAVLIVNHRRLAFSVVNGVSAMRTLPSLAILAIMMPFLGIRRLKPSIVAPDRRSPCHPFCMNASMSVYATSIRTPWKPPSGWV